MFFLLRVAFWLTIVLALLPSGGASTSGKAEASQPKIAATDAISAAGAAVSDVSGFCDRQPEACQVGAQAAVAIGQRAQAGARMVYDFINDRTSRGEADPVGKGDPKFTATVRTVPAFPGSQSTLKAADLDPAWEAPGANGASVSVPLPRKDPPSASLSASQFSSTPSKVRPIGPMDLPPIEEIVENFDLMEEWDDRYRYLIELGRALPPLPEAARTEANKVRGCASQVWLETLVKPNGGSDPVLNFRGDSDAHIVRGLIAVLLSLQSGKPAKQILANDAVALFEKLGLREHLTPQRSNGFRSMVDRIHRDAGEALATAD